MQIAFNCNHLMVKEECQVPISLCQVKAQCQDEKVDNSTESSNNCSHFQNCEIIIQIWL